MKKALDILPHKKKEYRHHGASRSKKEKKKAGKLFWGLVALVVLLGLILYFARSLKMPKTTSSTPSQSSSNYELFDSSGNTPLK